VDSIGGQTHRLRLEPGGASGAAHAEPGPGARRGAQPDELGPIAFLINADGTWLQLGTEEADHCIALTGATAAADSAFATSGFIQVEYGRSVVRIEFNPANTAEMALASLRPRLAVVELPVELAFRAVALSGERHSSGAAGLVRIDALVRPYREAAFARFAASVPIIGQNPVAMPGVGPGEYVVSDKGEWFRDNDPRLAEAVGFADPALDAIGYALRNMGFIKVTFREAGTVCIVLHPRNTEAAAVGSVTKRIETIDVGRFEIRYLGEEGWVSETHAGALAAATRLRKLCGIDAGARPRERWHLTTVTPAALAETGSEVLRLMHQKWRVSFGIFGESVFAFAMRHGLLGRLILAEAKRPGDDLIWRYIGDDFGTFFSEEFRFNAIGNSVREQPDRDYGQWVHAAYHSVVLTGAPRVDYIDAYLPGSARGPWIRYERLLLPWRLPTGETLVSVSSRIKSDRMLKRPA